MRKTEKPVEILLVEDNPADVQLVSMLLKETKLPHKMVSVPDGQAAIDYLFDKVKNQKAPRPELIILDLNLPRKDGREVLKEVKTNADTCGIPILVLTTSRDEEDVRRCYELHANCYITKPIDLSRYNAVMKSLEDFWFSTVELPKPRLVKGIK